MKNYTKRILSILLCMLMALTSVGVWTTSAYAQGKTVYVSVNGADSNDGASEATAVQTLTKAASLAGASGTVVVVDTVNVTPAELIPAATIKGKTPDSVINVTGWAMRMGGAATIENVTINASAAWSYILAMGHRLVIGDGVTVTKSDGINQQLSIRGGGEGNKIDGSCEVVIKSGAWQNIVAGTRNADVLGNTHVTLYDTAMVATVSLGVENAADAKTPGKVHGSGTVKLIGKSSPISGKIGIGTVSANAYLDITEYEGTVSEAWTDTGITVLTDSSNIPEDAKPASGGGVVGTSGKVYIDTPVGGKPDTVLSDVRIYLSDSGNDANDGKTPDKAVATLGKACSLAGKTGTVVVTDKFTQKNYDKLSCGKLEGANQDSKFILGVWKFDLGSDAIIDNITLSSGYNWAFVLCNGKKLTVGEGVKSTKEGEFTHLSIRGGGEGTSVSGSTEIVLKGGTWQSVFAATKKGSVSGNAVAVVHPGATVDVLCAGNDGEVDGNSIGGKAVLKLVGDKVNVKSIKSTGLAKGGVYLDISEFDGALPESWDTSAFSVTTEAGAVEPEVKEEPKAPEVTAPATGTPTKVVPGDGVVYLSDNGLNSNDGKTPEKPVPTLDMAIARGGTNPTIVIVDTYTYTTVKAVPACTITGLTSDSKLAISTWAFMCGGNITVENITLHAKANYSYFLAMGNTFTAGEGVTITRDEGIKTGFGIRGGGEGSELTKDSNVILKSGSWGDVHGGTRNHNINANTFITVYEGAAASSLNIGNNGVKEGNVMNGNGVLKLVGSPKVDRITAKPEYQNGEMYLDLTEYTGAFNDAWSESGATVITEKEKLPEFISDHNEKLTGEYDLSGITLFRYVSDTGSDENDGLTKDKPMKTIKAAVTSMGKGGTVIVTGTFTLNEYTSELPAFNLTSASAKDVFDFTFWAFFVGDTEIYNLNIVVGRDFNCVLHQGRPFKVGKNVNVTLKDGVKVYPLIRGNESGDVPLTDITIESGNWATVFAGTKKANVLGNAKVTVTGGSVETISVGPDGGSGRILGNTEIILKGNPSVVKVNDSLLRDGYAVADISELTTSVPTIATSINVIEDKTARFVPVNVSAIFINGYPDGTFLPEKVMTRAEAVTVASKIAGLNSVYKAPETTAFTDVTAADWFATNVKYLEAYGALEFFGTTFDANKGITRGEFVKLISAMIPESDSAAPAFSDVANTHPFYNEIIAAAKAGLVNGYPDGTFLPDNTLKRSEIVTILNRLTKRNIVASNAAALTKFSDIQGHWAAPQIIAASCEAVTDGVIIWYSGDEMAALSKVDKSTLELTTTKAALEGVDVNDSAAVAAAVEAYAVKRRAEIANTATTVNVTGTRYYVSEAGNDSADGKTPETAWKTLSKVSGAGLKEGDGVFFKRGDTFRGQLTTQKGVTYSAYGEGAKPNIYGSEKNYANIGYWQKTDRENIYVSSDVFTNDVGLIVFDGGKEWSFKHILGVRGFVGLLAKDLEMYHNKNDNKVYLYSVSDPNTRWSSVEIVPGRSGISGNGNNVTIDNLCIKYSGGHGIGYGSGTTGLTVSNCEMGWIGGMIQPSRESENVRFGNAVEIYESCKDYTITNCHIYQVYDAGVTHQYFQTKGTRVDMQNVKYTDNVIEYCTYDIEYVNAQPADKGIMENVEISGNLLLHGGEGWGNQRPDRGDAVIKGWSSVNYGVNNLFYDNVISSADPACMLLHIAVAKNTYMPEIYGNVFIGKKGTSLFIYDIGVVYNKRKYDESLTKTTVGLDDNTMIYLD